LPDVVSLERRWSNWVTAGSPDISEATNSQIAQADAQEMRKKGIIVRSQSPDNSTASARKPEFSNAAPTSPVDRGDEIEAPSPVARTARPDSRTAQSDLSLEPTLSDESVAEQRAAERRREGRERMIKEGWEPLPAATGAPQMHANTEQPGSREAQADESPARKRFRSAKEQHASEAAAGLGENEDPFEETRSVTNPRDFDRADSPFHSEN